MSADFSTTRLNTSQTIIQIIPPFNVTMTFDMSLPTIITHCAASENHPYIIGQVKGGTYIRRRLNNTLIADLFTLQRKNFNTMKMSEIPTILTASFMEDAKT